MRKPNGYGTVVKLSGNRRNPYVARKTVGFNDKGQPVYKAIGYYATKNEALAALANYNNNPYDLDKNVITLKELFNLFCNKKSSKISISLFKALKTAFKHCEKLNNFKYKDIKAYHMQDTIDNCGHGLATKYKIKSFWQNMDKFALEMDIIDKTYSLLIEVSEKGHTRLKRTIFTSQEIHQIWQSDDEFKDIVLIYLYTGMRFSELLELKTTDIDLINNTFTAGLKTQAGINRLIPIHSAILPIVQKKINLTNEYFITVSPSTIRKKWYKFMADLGQDHTPHECRHTFRTALDNANGNKICINLIMGHKSKDVGEQVYVHKFLKDLRETIELITY